MEIFSLQKNGAVKMKISHKWGGGEATDKKTSI